MYVLYMYYIYTCAYERRSLENVSYNCTYLPDAAVLPTMAKCRRHHDAPRYEVGHRGTYHYHTYTHTGAYTPLRILRIYRKKRGEERRGEGLRGWGGGESKGREGPS